MTGRLHRTDAVRRVMRHRDLRRLQLGWTSFFVVDGISMVALSVWAFGRGGAAAVGVLGVSRLLPGAVALPFGAWAADRFPRPRVVAAVFLAMAGTQALIAVALAGDAPAAAVYGLVAVGSVAATPYRPAQLALVPLVARTPAELVATNVAAGLLEGVATFAGPALAGLLLVRSDPWFVVLVAATAALGGFLAVTAIRVDVDPSKAVRRERERPWAAMVGGVAELRRNTDAAVIIGCFIAQLLVRGVLTVLLVSVSFDLLDLGRGGVGWLAAAMGVGGIVGGFFAMSLTARRRLTGPFALALHLWGLPIIAIGLAADVAVVAAALVVVGIGNAILDVSGFTLVQRLCSDRTLGRVFGVLFTVGIAIGGVGALAAPALASAFGLRPVLVATGALLPLLAVTLRRRFGTIDRHSEPSPVLLGLFSRIPLLAPLPATTLEKVAASSTSMDAPASAEIVTEGDRGDRFYVIETGSVEVRRGGVHQAQLGPGDHFGEIALLRDGTRTATVTAVTDVRLATLGSVEFLDALSSSDTAYGIAWRATSAIVAAHEPPAP